MKLKIAAVAAAVLAVAGIATVWNLSSGPQFWIGSGLIALAFLILLPVAIAIWRE